MSLMNLHVVVHPVVIIISAKLHVYLTRVTSTKSMGWKTVGGMDNSFLLQMVCNNSFGINCLINSCGRDIMMT